MYYYTIYRTINQVNGKSYIGMHKTKNPNDYYLGSGIHLKKAIEKYGKENFKKEILYIFDTNDEMVAMEKKIVTEEYISDRNNYNAKVGGRGGFSRENALKGNAAAHAVGAHIKGAMKASETSCFKNKVFASECAKKSWAKRRNKE